MRKNPFHILIAPDANGTASGNLYLDDGDSVEQDGVSVIKFAWSVSRLSVTGDFEYDPDGDDADSRAIARVTILGVEQAPADDAVVMLRKGDDDVEIGNENWTYNGTSQSLEVRFEDEVEFDEGFSLQL